MIRNPGALQPLTERRELGPIIAKAREAFTEVAGNRQEWTFVHAVTGYFEALLPAELPTFWSEEISTLFSDMAMVAPNAHPKLPTLEEKIQSAVDLRQEGISYREIARRFNVSVGTSYNWVNDFPYEVD